MQVDVQSAKSVLTLGGAAPRAVRSLASIAAARPVVSPVPAGSWMMAAWRSSTGAAAAVAAQPAASRSQRGRAVIILSVDQLICPIPASGHATRIALGRATSAGNSSRIERSPRDALIPYFPLGLAPRRIVGFVLPRGRARNTALSLRRPARRDGQ